MYVYICAWLLSFVLDAGACGFVRVAPCKAYYSPHVILDRISWPAKLLCRYTNMHASRDTLIYARVLQVMLRISSSMLLYITPVILFLVQVLGLSTVVDLWELTTDTT